VTRPGPGPKFWRGAVAGIALAAAIWFILWITVIVA
jgi:ABC-type transporter Mla subunit MlaD